MVYFVVKHLHSLTHISVISLTLWRWCSGTFSSDSLRDKNCSPAENSAVEKPVLRERHENWTQDNNSSESVQNLWQNVQGKGTKEEKRKRETNMLNVVAPNSLISAHIYLILEGPENVKISFVGSLKSKQTNFHPVPVRNRLFCLHGQYIGRICPGLNIFLFAPFSRRCRSWSRSNVKEKFLIFVVCHNAN